MTEDHKTLTADEDNFVLYDEDEMSLSLRITEFTSDKQQKYFIKKVEKIIRGSTEYKVWTDYIRDTLGKTKCMITDEDHEETTVDIHHHPISLYVIVKGVVMEHIKNERSFCSFDIAAKVMELHFSLKAPFIPLVKSLHEKFHRGYLQIPMELVHGNWEDYMEEYEHYLDKEDIMKVVHRSEIKLENLKDNKEWYKFISDNKETPNTN